MAVDLDALEADELRDELGRMTPAELEQAICDGIYNHPRGDSDRAQAIRCIGALYAAIRDASADNTLPLAVDRAWDVLISTVVESTLPHRAEERDRNWWGRP